jgi:hypothetical protein
MVQNLVKSPLTWSIGGVGAIAIVIILASYLGQTPDPDPDPDPGLAPGSTLDGLSSSLWQQGTALGWQAAVAAQTAQTQAEWQQVVALWGQAIVPLGRVPGGDPNYAQAQAKVAEYQANQAIAEVRRARARAEAVSPVAPALQKALSAAPIPFAFAPSPTAKAATTTVTGRSADGLATVELADNRATLVVPRSDQNGALTMTQVVYASQFLAIAAPAVPSQPWLLESLRNVQRDRPPTIPVGTPVTVSVGPETLVITTVSQP